jgi:hypothetical protein
MKKLLFLSSLIYIFCFIASCQNKKVFQSEGTSKVVSKDSTIASDTNKVETQTAPAGTIGTTPSTKEQVKAGGNQRVTHAAPQQTKIDSIKNSKLKGKK